MPCCAVASCRNHSDHAKKLKLSFYTFPKDPNLHKEWVQFCKRNDDFNSKLARICSEHFLPSDFQRDLRSELLGLPPKHLLKQGAVPSSYRSTIHFTTRPLRTKHKNTKEVNLAAEAVAEGPHKSRPTEGSAETLGHIKVHRSIKEDRHPSKQHTTRHLQPDDHAHREWIAERDSINTFRMEEEVRIKCEPKWSSGDSNLEDENNEEHQPISQVWIKEEIKEEHHDPLQNIAEAADKQELQLEDLPDSSNECLAESKDSENAHRMEEEVGIKCEPKWSSRDSNLNVENGEERNNEYKPKLHHVKAVCETKTVLVQELSVSDVRVPPEAIRMKYCCKQNMLLGKNCDVCKKPFDIPKCIYKCPICNKAFTKYYRLQNHVTKHGDKKIQCDVCLKIFQYQSKLNKHKLTVHSAERNFPCPTCGKGFKTSDKLERHLVGHRGERNYPCSVCGKLFMHRSTLSTHLGTHTGDKRFQCAVCSKRFYQRNTLVNHERLHTGEKPYKCDLCEMKFPRRGHLVRHLSKHHQIT